jgi:hypothetical protein
LEVKKPLHWLQGNGTRNKNSVTDRLLEYGSPGRTRTCDQPVNSRLLYQLSYRGTRGSV